jgi:hypothetical protein
MSKSDQAFDRAREQTRNIAYATRCFQLWGVLRATAHQLGLLMDDNTAADKNARKFVADLYAFADGKCQLCAAWLETHQPELDRAMTGIIEGSEERVKI